MPIVPESYDELENDDLLRGKDADEGGATWAKVILVGARVIGYMIVPSIIAMWLVYQSSLWGPKIQALELSTQADVAQVRSVAAKIEEQNDSLLRMLQRICSNTAKTTDERQRCFDK